jgi:hypothetical protein
MVTLENASCHCQGKRSTGKIHAMEDEGDEVKFVARSLPTMEESCCGVEA